MAKKKKATAKPENSTTLECTPTKDEQETIEVPEPTRSAHDPRGAILSAQDYILGMENQVLGQGFLTHVRTQHKAGIPMMRSGTRKEWNAEFEKWANTPLMV